MINDVQKILATSDDVVSTIQSIYESCDIESKNYLKNILHELSVDGYSSTYEQLWQADYWERPVSIDEFLDSDTYLGKATRNGQAIYPYWRKCLNEIFSSGNKWEEIILTGATRIGKSSTAITAIAYMLYKMMCLKDPQKYFGKKDVSIFSILFFNITEDLAKGVAFREFNDTLKTSPWFCSHGSFSKSERDFYYIPEGGKITIDFGSDSSHGLGKQVFCCMLDEVNFSQAGIKDISKAKAKIKDTYNTLAARVKGTFRMNGEVFGKIFAVSSKKSDSDFMEDYVQTQLSAGAGDHMYVADKPQWEVLPESMFSKEKFCIAVGDRNLKGFVIPDNQSDEASLLDIQNQGYKILKPPINMKSEFLADFDIALRDLAGISVPGALSFITQEYLSKCICVDRKNPFYSDILTVGTQDSSRIEDYFHIDCIPQSLRRCPIFIHLDLSLNTDRTGISAVCISGRKEIEDIDKNKISQISFDHLFSIALQARRGDKIPYQKIVEFICWLRKSGFNICRISRDQFQSEYVGQVLEAQGFTVDKISLDRTPDGYLTLRNVIVEQRVIMLDVQLLQDELIYLQRDSVTGKVDHIVGRSKDVSDSFAGAIWNAITHNPGVKVPSKKIASAISSVNGVRRSNATTLPSMFTGVRKLY